MTPEEAAHELFVVVGFSLFHGWSTYPPLKVQKKWFNKAVLRETNG